MHHPITFPTVSAPGPLETIMPVTRRHFLTCTALAAPALLPTAAGALSLEAAPIPIRDSYASRCQADGALEQALDAVRREPTLPHDPAVLEQLASGLRDLQACPLCGCPARIVAGRLTHDAKDSYPKHQQ